MNNFKDVKEVSPEELLKRLKNSDNSYDKQQDRIKKALGVDSIEDMDVNPVNLKKYLEYLKKNIEIPCHMNGVEDFQWEERYVIGGWDQAEYKRLKKTKPSYTDTFELIDYELEETQIFVKVKRVSDNKKFELPLDELKAVDKKSKNYGILDDYSVWYVNH